MKSYALIFGVLAACAVVIKAQKSGPLLTTLLPKDTKLGRHKRTIPIVDNVIRTVGDTIVGLGQGLFGPRVVPVYVPGYPNYGYPGFNHMQGPGNGFGFVPGPGVPGYWPGFGAPGHANGFVGPNWNYVPNNGAFNGPYNGPYNGPNNGPYNGPYNGPNNGPDNRPDNGPYNGPYNGPNNGPYNGPNNGPYNGPNNGPNNGFNQGSGQKLSLKPTNHEDHNQSEGSGAGCRFTYRSSTIEC